MKKPMIGVPLAYCNAGFQPDQASLPTFSDFPFYALRIYEANAIYQAGGAPFYLPYVWEEIDAYLDLCQGLVFPGGGGSFETHIPPHTNVSEYLLNPQANPDLVRTTYELELLSRALKRNIPIMGLCRGAQLINKAFGGELGQVDTLQSPLFEPLVHWYKTPADLAHPITITPGSILAHCAGSEKNFETNSIHHEAISRLGKNLKITARTSDGIIEAIESTSHDWVVGLQWHPEFLLTSLVPPYLLLLLTLAKAPRNLFYTPGENGVQPKELLPIRSIMLDLNIPVLFL